MAKARRPKEEIARNAKIKSIREWRIARKRGSDNRPNEKSRLAKLQLRKWQALHPLAIWPSTGRVPEQDGATRIDIPPVFSFIENPSDSLRALYRLRAALDTPKVKQLYFNHKECQLLDLCASIVTDVLVLRGRIQRTIQANRFAVAGNFSSNPDVNVILKASGILRHLGLSAAQLPAEVADRLELCSLVQGSPSAPERSSESELAATALAGFFNRCLSTEKYRLKDEWQSKLISLITEVIDNSEQHSRSDRYWYTIGHFNRLPGEAGGECHIVLFNFGDSIYESLKRPETSTSLKRQISDLADIHRTRGFFEFLSGKKQEWDEETLWTLYALQEGVSRFSGTAEGEDRGNGTIRMIEFFRDLAGEKPKMALVSGSTFILFDETFKLRNRVMPNGEMRKIVAFNEENDLLKPPDKRYVQRLSYRFPGTLVSLRFVLHRDYLKNVREVVREDT